MNLVTKKYNHPQNNSQSFKARFTVIGKKDISIKDPVKIINTADNNLMKAYNLIEHYFKDKTSFASDYAGSYWVYFKDKWLEYHNGRGINLKYPIKIEDIPEDINWACFLTGKDAQDFQKEAEALEPLFENDSIEDLEKHVKFCSDARKALCRSIPTENVIDARDIIKWFKKEKQNHGIIAFFRKTFNRVSGKPYIQERLSIGNEKVGTLLDYEH